jgi:hypothetical protein
VKASPDRVDDVALRGSRSRTARTPLTAEPKTKGSAEQTIKPLEMTRIGFSKKMQGRFGSGSDATLNGPRQAEFFGDVEALHGPINDESADLDPDQPPIQYVFLTSHYLLVTSEPPATGSSASARTWLNAIGNPADAANRNERGQESAIQGDQITYDSLKKQFYIYGYDGHDVHITQSTAPGQPTSNGNGKSARYNLETGEFHMDAPKNFRLFDSLKTGTRAPDIKPPDRNAKPPKRTHREPKAPPRSDKERRGFTGR